MLVFGKARLVLLSMPKTGTTALASALAPHASLAITDPPMLKHSPVFRYNRYFRPMIERFIGEDLIVMAMMREPVSWLGSWYRYRQRPGMEGHANSTCGISFDEFVLGYMKGDTPDFANVGSQAKFLEPQRNGTAITHLFRYEDQAGVIGFLQEKLQVPIETRAENASPERALTLSAGVARRLRRKLAPEFTLYDGIGSGGRFTPLPAGD